VNFYNTFVLSVGSDRTPASALTKVHTVSITFVRLLRKNPINVMPNGIIFTHRHHEYWLVVSG
ncbi:hypothetical protein, partial [Aerosakkonema funiforme]|uniref:hypothetical protein n=1 Tax=Aerosakkonema funiforme TaxID=1246630 RepID=UPI001A7F0F9A